MTTSIFVNLTTTDLERSKTFYEALGYTINPMFTDNNGACVVLSDTVYFMVLTREHMATFTDKQLVDPKTSTAGMLALSCESREAVDAMIEKGLTAGGTEPREPQDYGFMYSRDLDDPDGNSLSYLFMPPAAVEQGPEAYLANQDAAPSA